MEHTAFKTGSLSEALWLTPVIPALRKWRLENWYDFEISVGESEAPTQK